MDHQAEASHNRDASTESIDESEHAGKSWILYDWDNEAAVYDCDSNQLHSYMAAGFPEKFFLAKKEMEIQDERFEL